MVAVLNKPQPEETSLPKITAVSSVYRRNVNIAMCSTENLASAPCAPRWWWRIPNGCMYGPGISLSLIPEATHKAA
jgi:hypothetical protein